MRIAMVGTGYVGLVSGTCFAEFGFHITCVDRDKEKIRRLKQGEIPIYEPGLDNLLAQQINAGRISFTTNLKEAVEEADAIFIAVGTPSRRSKNPENQVSYDEADLSAVYAVAREVAPLLTDYKVVVTKSTVPVGTAREIEHIIREENPEAQFDVASNPEFLREGAAINDFMRPDRVVIGTSSGRAQDVLRAIYRPLYINETPIVFTKRETAEIIKYAANAFLATKITFINEVADLCEKAGGNVQDVARALGLDGRISPKFMHAGPGFGGSCFPKDTMALANTGRKLGAPQSIVEAVVEVNENRKKQMAQRVIDVFGGDLSGKRIGILGIAFKPNTDDVRDAPSLTIIPMLQEHGARVVATDPAAKEQASKILKDIEWKDNAYDVADGADAIMILTEWNAFRGLDLGRIGDAMTSRLLFDCRNIYKLDEIKKYDFRYISVGRPEYQPNQTKDVKLKSVS